MQIEEHKLLSPFTTIGVGGRARWYTCCSNEQEIVTALKWGKSQGHRIFVLAGGSNSLISDDGFPGLVLHIKTKGIDWQKDGLVTVAAGEDWDHLVQQAVLKGYTGIECLSGIPGSVGSTPIQNVGAYGQEVKDTIIRVDTIDRETLLKRSFANNECHFSYRMSRFKGEDRDRYLITAVTFQLKAHGTPHIKYPELEKSLQTIPAWTSNATSLADRLNLIRNTVIEIRSRKGMVLRADDPDSRSLGSFFMNPIISTKDKSRLQSQIELEKISPAPQFYPIEGHPDLWKISAAWLIEHSGTKKGETLGGAAVSSKHTLALVNHHDASARDILNLATTIRTRVRAKFSLELHQEPDLIS